MWFHEIYKHCCVKNKKMLRLGNGKEGVLIMKENKEKDVTIISDLEKKELVKKETNDTTEQSWKKEIYGFECGNWTCKC